MHGIFVWTCICMSTNYKPKTSLITKPTAQVSTNAIYLKLQISYTLSAQHPTNRLPSTLPLLHTLIHVKFANEVVVYRFIAFSNLWSKVLAHQKVYIHKSKIQPNSVPQTQIYYSTILNPTKRISVFNLRNRVMIK